DVSAQLNVNATTYARLTHADFGLQAGDAGTAFELKNGTFTAAIGGVGAVSATTVLVRYTGAAPVSAGTTLTVGSTSYTFVEAIAVNTIAFELTGFAANVANFVSLSGNLGLQLSGANLVAVGADVSAALNVNASTYARLLHADFGLQAGDAGTAFELKNGSFTAAIGGVGAVSATTVLVRYTGATPVSAGTTLTVGSTSYT